MNVTDLRAELSHRLALHPNDDFGIEESWKKLTEILSENVDDTIAFLENDCTADEFSWLSEVFDDVAEKTQSKAFVDCLYRVAKKYPEECKKYYIDRVLMYAEGALNVE